MAIVPSVLNPVFETVTGEVPGSFNSSPNLLPKGWLFCLPLRASNEGLLEGLLRPRLSLP